jgi:hypothetical protein
VPSDHGRESRHRQLRRRLRDRRGRRLGVGGPRPALGRRGACVGDALGHAVQSTESAHVRQSEALRDLPRSIRPRSTSEAGGRRAAGQVPYQEWRHSEFRETRSCQDCHMPKVGGTDPLRRSSACRARRSRSAPSVAATRSSSGS